MKLKVGHIIIIISSYLLYTTATSCVKEAKCDCSADTVRIARIFQPTASIGKDAVIESIAPDQNFGNQTMFAVFSWTSSGVFNNARALIQFDFSSIPSQTSIAKAELSLYWKPYSNLTDQTGENAFSIYRVTQPWTESTVTWNNQPTFNNTPKVAVPKTMAVDQSLLNIDVTTMVQDMINNPSSNFGFMLQLNNEFPYSLVILASSNDPDQSKHPKLIVSF